MAQPEYGIIDHHILIFVPMRIWHCHAMAAFH